MQVDSACDCCPIWSNLTDLPECPAEYIHEDPADAHPSLIQVHSGQGSQRSSQLHEQSLNTRLLIVGFYFPSISSIVGSRFILPFPLDRSDPRCPLCDFACCCSCRSLSIPVHRIGP